MIRTAVVAVVLALGAADAIVATAQEFGTPASGDGRLASVEAPPVLQRKAIRHKAAHLHVAVDIVRLKSGTTLRGGIVHAAAEGSLTMAVSRKWLRKTNPALFTKRTSSEASVRTTASRSCEIESIGSWARFRKTHGSARSCDRNANVSRSCLSRHAHPRNRSSCGSI